jgi:hypothetical protein
MLRLRPGTPILHRSIISLFPSCSSIAEHPLDKRKTQERYLPGRPSSPKRKNIDFMKATFRISNPFLVRQGSQPGRRIIAVFKAARARVIKAARRAEAADGEKPPGSVASGLSETRHIPIRWMV